jgi:hypothetical protein
MCNRFLGFFITRRDDFEFSYSVRSRRNRIFTFQYHGRYTSLDTLRGFILNSNLLDPKRLSES